MTPQLVVKEGKFKNIVLNLNEDRFEWIVGRNPEECDLIIEDPLVSRKHFKLTKTESGMLLENLNSENPIYLNNKELTAPQVIEESDLIKIGSNSYTYFPNGASAEFLQAQKSEEPSHYETIFQEEEIPQGLEVTLKESSRWLLKVMSGPNIGAEFFLLPDKAYTLGTDPSSCDIVFHDLSVSRQHAKIYVDKEEHLFIEDLKSRNGVLINGKIIKEKIPLPPNKIISLGTTSLLIIDQEGASDTIVSLPTIVEAANHPSAPLKTAPLPQLAKSTLETPPPGQKKRFNLGLALITALILFLGLFLINSLFQSKNVPLAKTQPEKLIEQALQTYPAVQYSFTRSTGKLMLLGHVSMPTEKDQLLYRLQDLNFIKSVENRIVVDEFVWQEMNQILAENPQWKSITMQTAGPGKFVLKGYLKTNQEAEELHDYVNANFHYLSELENAVVVEENLINQILTILDSNELTNVDCKITDGIISLTGYVSATESKRLDETIKKIESLFGVRSLKNYVVKVSPEYALINISDRYPISGFSKKDNVNLSVVINDNIYAVGDLLDGMKIIGITSNTILLEKDGFKYRIDYNK